MNNNLGPGHYAECDNSAASTDKDYDFAVDGEEQSPVDIAASITVACAMLESTFAAVGNFGSSNSKSGSGNSKSGSGSSDSSSSSTSSSPSGSGD